MASVSGEEGSFDIGTLCQLETDLETALGHLGQYERNAVAFNVSFSDVQSTRTHLEWLFWNVKVIYQKTAIQSSAFFHQCKKLGLVADEIRLEIEKIYNRLAEMDATFAVISNRMTVVADRLTAIEGRLAAVEARLTNLEQQNGEILLYLRDGERRMVKMEETLNKVCQAAIYLILDSAANKGLLPEPEAMDVAG